jgi:hypothetical protein
MFRFSKSDCPILTDLAYVSLFCTFLINVIKNVQNDISRPKLNFIQYAHI